ncbi:hypothetical protein [Acidaminobacter hydrogenoformans]|uniref:hypothetical protein n=1 Tax=Acidaminobacter hydrogenoformans TaxID=65403 RepID=UPI0011134FE6|nr:hypothetical protein [Acidaminobacter hydrogenoformans]
MSFCVMITGLRQVLVLSFFTTFLFMLAGMLLVPFVVLKGLEERRNVRGAILNQAIYGMTYRYGLLIQGGHSLRKALLIAMENEAETLMSFPAWRQTRLRLIQGGDYEAAVMPLMVLEHQGTKNWARSCLYGERKSEEDVVKMLHDWMEAFRADAQQSEATQLVTGQLWLMMPAFFQFGILMVLLISPIFMGGL